METDRKVGTENANLVDIGIVSQTMETVNLGMGIDKVTMEVEVVVVEDFEEVVDQIEECLAEEGVDQLVIRMYLQGLPGLMIDQ